MKSLAPFLQVGLWEEARQHQAGEGEGASEAQVQAGAQGRPEGDQEGHALPGRREAQGGHGQVSGDVVYLFIYFCWILVEDSNGFLLFFPSLRDAERKRKVRELMGSLASQEGEWKALKKRKRK